MNSCISCSGLSSCVGSGIPGKTRLSLMLRDSKWSTVSFMSLFSFAMEASWVERGNGVLDGFVFFSQYECLFLAEFQAFAQLLEFFVKNFYESDS